MTHIQALDDPRIPDNWRREIEAGSEFGQRALKAIEKLKPIGWSRTVEPDHLSTIGTQLREIIEAEIGNNLGCGQCIGYLKSLNQQATHDHDAIVKYLSAEFPWPADWREKHPKGVRASRISELIIPVVPSSVSVDPVPLTRDAGTLQFLIPYILSESASDELRWCLRSIHKHYQGQAHVTLIGDKPDWYVGHHIAKKRLSAQSFRRYRDSLSKIDMIRYSGEVGPDVMWCMDDCYFLRPFVADDFAQGRLNDRKPGKGSDDWNVMLRLTAVAQKKAGLPVLDFSCHLPQMINRDRWNEMFERFEMAKQPLVWESMYGSMFAVNPQGHKAFMLRLRNAGALQQHQQRLDRSWLLNHTHEAWSAQMRQWLSERLPEPCKDERH